MEQYDVLVIGAGIAGASAAANLAPELRVAILEQEAQPGYHSTGRSAAIYSEIYGPEQVRVLTRASRDFYCSPPAGFTEAPLVSPRGYLFVATSDRVAELERFATLPDVAPAVEWVPVERVCELSPLLRPGYAAAAALEPGCLDIDVHALHSGYLRIVRARGRLVTDAPVQRLEFIAGLWQAETPRGSFAAPVVVNAAGAWADALGAMAGVGGCGIQPFRRTAFTVDAPDLPGLRASPMTADIDEQFYWKPDAGRILISLAEETLAAAGDAQPEELDIALAVERVEAATILEIRRIQRKWAGLRSFAADRVPVIGFTSKAEGFFWLAGQGGYGIQTAPAAGRLAAALIARRAVPEDLARLGLDAAALAPDRPALAGPAAQAQNM
jgi:D-arginine dehydrogenase